MPTPRRDVDGILLLYHFIPPYAETVLEHAGAFERHSRFPVWSLNTAERMPAALRELRFRAIVLHYSLFGGADYRLSPAYREYLAGTGDSLRVAFFQDEHVHTRQRFAFVDECRIDWVYTLLRPDDAARVYGERTHGPRLFSTIPGYVSEGMLAHAARFARPDLDRHTDVGYRARSLPFSSGRGGHEKAEIGRRFLAEAARHGLRLDIGVDEADRLYGDDWYRFLGSCRAVLGVEAGVSIFDLDDEAQRATDVLLAAEPDLAFEEVERRLLHRWEDNVYYRTVSPRHFEAAAFRTCQILFEGEYSGIMAAGVHYVPLRKDFANLDEVIATFRDERRRTEVVETAFRDLIASDRYTYANFVRGFDDALEDAGVLSPGRSRRTDVDRALARGAATRRLERRLRTGYWRSRVAVRAALRPTRRPRRRR